MTAVRREVRGLVADKLRYWALRLEVWAYRLDGEWGECRAAAAPGLVSDEVVAARLAGYAAALAASRVTRHQPVHMTPSPAERAAAAADLERADLVSRLRSSRGDWPRP